jgi:hypothetical protein
VTSLNDCGPGARVDPDFGSPSSSPPRQPTASSVMLSDEIEMETSELARRRALNALNKADEHERQENARVRRKIEKIVERLKASASKKPHEKSRRDADVDRAIFNRILAGLAAKDTISLTGRSGPTVTDIRSRTRRIRTPTSEVISVNGHGSILLVPHWEHTGDRLKMLAWGMVMKEMGGEAMSLHLSRQVIRNGMRSAKGLAANLRDRITKRLRARFAGSIHAAPEFFFFIETAPGIDPHLHGAISIPPGMRNEVEAALRDAGGAWGTGTRQLDLRPITDAAGWAAYISKFTHTTAYLLQDSRIAAATNGLRRLAKTWYTLRRKNGAHIS